LSARRLQKDKTVLPESRCGATSVLRSPRRLLRKGEERLRGNSFFMDYNQLQNRISRNRTLTLDDGAFSILKKRLLKINTPVFFRTLKTRQYIRTPFKPSRIYRTGLLIWFLLTHRTILIKDFI
jgi:hypothetical protein